ncbi:iron chaperone [Paenibacillus sp. PR3]|uniref:Iron chaperone n=1 Tax=Paenibacillus terricola TaxID=2763503 RepID=A0ABR8MTD2_9BACL|nr:iron chaperone [Paenibacillus terricola]MBD3919226.1 iron chaperone [Paenibacillus terricola]
MDVFDEFTSRIENPSNRERMEEVLRWVAVQFPNLGTKIAWNQPMFTDHDTFIIGFSVAKQHMSVAPERAAIARFSDEIVRVGYDHTDQLFRMKWNLPVDYDLLGRIIAFNIEDKADCTTFWRK